MTIDFLREPDVSPDQFFSLVDEGMFGMIRFAVVHAAGVLGLFDQLDRRSCIVLDLAALLGIDERSLSPLLSLLCGIGLVSGEGEVYTNTLLAFVFLVSGSPPCQKGHIHRNAVFLEKSGPHSRNGSSRVRWYSIARSSSATSPSRQWPKMP